MATKYCSTALAAVGDGVVPVVINALGAVSGPLHGAASGTVHRLFSQAETVGADAALTSTFEQGGKVPGIGNFIHRRHELLMAALRDADVPDERMAVVHAVVSRTAQRIPVAPNVDLALGALTYFTGMVPDAGEAIFATAHTAGWLAHAVEEYGEAPIRFRPATRNPAAAPTPGCSERPTGPSAGRPPPTE